jgi:methyl-galactoside transport system permease protein
MNEKVKYFMAHNAMYVILIVMILAIAIYEPNFISGTTFRDIMIQSSTRMIIAFGAALILITAGCDLAAGRIVGLAAVISASMLQDPGYSRLFFPDLGQNPMSLAVPIIIAVFACVLVGTLSGILVAKFYVPPFIATLGMMLVAYGANSIYFDMTPNNSQPIGGLRADFTQIGSGSLNLFGMQIPIIVLIALLFIAFAYFLFNKTVLGKNMFAIGGNPQAAVVSGINVAGSLILLYAIAGGLYGVGGILEAARTGGATNNYGMGYEFDAISACVVGGVSLAGGVGTVKGIVAGVLIFSVINYALTFIGLSPYWQLIVKGCIIIVAVAIDIRNYIAKK